MATAVGSTIRPLAIAAALAQLADLVTFQVFYRPPLVVELNPFANAIAIGLGPLWVLPFKLALVAMMFALASKLTKARDLRIGLLTIAIVGLLGTAGNTGLLILTI